jgi:hypothetical protein
MGQAKITPMIVLVEILLCEHWLSTWPTAHGLEQVDVGISREGGYSSHMVNMPVFQAKITAI